MYLKGFVFSIVFLCVIEIQAQLPNTNLYLVQFVENSGTIEIKNPSFLTSFNQDGYNNQPYFKNPSTVYFTTDFRGEGFTDIAILDLEYNTYSFFTKTDSISEYSPTVTPDAHHVSVVRQQGKSQMLWQYPMDKSNSGKPLISVLKDVGYHCWLDEQNLALFRVTDPIALAMVNIRSNKVVTKLNDIGRCMKMDGNGMLVFVHKITADFWYLKRYDPNTGKISVIAEMDVEDFEILPSGTFIKGKGSKLYKMNENDVNWVEFDDLTELGISDISRITSSRNKLIFVAK